MKFFSRALKSIQHTTPLSLDPLLTPLGFGRLLEQNKKSEDVTLGQVLIWLLSVFLYMIAAL